MEEEALAVIGLENCEASYKTDLVWRTNTITNIILTRNEFYAMLGVMVITLIMTFLLAFVLKWTPAWTFFRARLKKLPIVRILTRYGSSKYVLAHNPWRGTADLKDKACEGIIELTPETGITDMKSGVKVFDMFTEFATTIPPEYSSVVQALRERGLRVNDWSDYSLYCTLAHPLQGQEMIEKTKNDKEKQRLKVIREKLQGLKVEIKPYKTYKLSNLANMFPFNVRPEYIQAKVIYAVTEKIKRMKLDTQKWVTVGIFCILIAIALVIIVKFAKSPDCPACQCLIEAAKGGVQTVSNAVNLTNGTTI